MRPRAAPFRDALGPQNGLTIDDGTCSEICSVSQAKFPKRFSRRDPGKEISAHLRGQLTDNLVNLAITNAGRAGKPAEGRDSGPKVEAGRANGATSRRRERRTGCPGKGRNAAVRGGKSFISASIGPIDALWGPDFGIPAVTHLLNIVTMKGGLEMVVVQ